MVLLHSPGIFRAVKWSCCIALEYLERYLEFFAVFQIFVYSTISREKPKDVLRNPGWKKLC
jgi:hypothetical protein